jgi:hypothetical protein
MEPAPRKGPEQWYAPGPIALILLAIAATLWVFVANGGLLTYIDSAHYIKRGVVLVQTLGFGEDLVLPAPAPDPDAPAQASPGGEQSMDGSRAMVYSLLTALSLLAGSVEGIALMNAVVAVGTLLFAFSVVLRDLPVHPGAARLTFRCVLVASLGSLPFYVAYLMPDIFAPVLIVLAALLGAAGPRMRKPEIAAAVLLGAVAVTVHLSHLAMAIVLLPAVALFAFFQGGERRWVAPLALLVMVGAGVAEQGLLRITARESRNAEVIYRPFLVARLIEDGPGYTYLADNCPDAAEPICPLYEKLLLSDDPARFYATSISFARDPRIGSWYLLPPDQQIAVAQGQFAFFLRVVSDRPFESAAAFLRNVFRQLALNSVVMTLQTDQIVARTKGLPGFAFTGSGHGRLTAWTGWLPFADAAQMVLYGVSAAIAVALLASRRLPRPAAVFLGFVLLGILANAVICGGLSQPADRYGSRVAWLWPVAAVFGVSVLWSMRSARRQGTLYTL